MKSTYVFVFSILMTSTAWAGSHGNGHMQAMPSYAYAYCYAHNPRIAYFSRVFHVTSAGNRGDKAWAGYLTRSGYANVLGECRFAMTEAAGAAAKKEAEDGFRATYRHIKIVQTDWSGS